jgi:NADH-quinone oxidoreductase subunit A
MESVSILVPPVAFLFLLGVVWLFSAGLGRLAFRRPQQPGGASEPYACGEDLPTHMIQPNYGQFLPFAFFFTLLHVVALMIATVPVEALATLLFAVIYVGAAAVGMAILFRE